MELHDLDQYLRLVAPPDASQFQIENLTAMRLTHGEPLSAFQYEAVRVALAEHEATALGGEDIVTSVEPLAPVAAAEPRPRRQSNEFSTRRE